jgi:hypothetical protein
VGRAEDPHDLVAWVNEIEHMPARREEDPHDLASWVNEIEHTDLASASFPISPSTEASSVGREEDPHDRAPWVNQVEKNRARWPPF